MISELEKRVVRLIPIDLPLVARPYAQLAAEAGLTEGAFLIHIRELRRRGIIRRFGATLRHQEAGFRSNAMVAWIVPAERVDEVGRALARFREVTHCYQRRSRKEWPYNLYSMIHAGNRRQCAELAKRMSAATGVGDYALLFSEKEFKKTSMEYF